MYCSGVHQCLVRAYRSKQSAIAKCVSPNDRIFAEHASVTSAAAAGVIDESFEYLANASRMNRRTSPSFWPTPAGIFASPPAASRLEPLPPKKVKPCLTPTFFAKVSAALGRTPSSPNKCRTISSSDNGRRKGARFCPGCRMTYLILSSVTTRLDTRVATTPAAVAAANPAS